MEVTEASPANSADPICRSLLVKLAARCNIACRYCYWFRDEEVYAAPAVMTPEVEAALLDKLEGHIRRHGLPSFSVLFHGGEPLLFGKQRFRGLCAALRELEGALGCRVSLSVTTNGLPLDAEWLELLKRFRVSVGISLDGPAAIHDVNRIDFKGAGTHAAVVRAIKLLQSGGWEPGLLAVCNPSVDPEQTVRHFVEELGIKAFDVLVPDATHEDRPATIAPYYTRLFDLWYGRYAGQDVQIRYLESILRGLLGGRSGSQSIGYGAITAVTLLTDGSLEALDVLRIAGSGSTRSHINILTHEIQDIQSDPLWREIYEASIQLAPPCRACEFKTVCGGGHMASRWSASRRYDNPSVYCDDIKAILKHIWGRIAPDLYIEPIEGTHD
ncbi:radical SAM protein [Sorangium sp. So ce1099]|uniref:radical SAM protein n=1 Tax=Sorangium sp. So ce1099 TaxID=3133331 RepID=UPI003F641371